MQTTSLAKHSAWRPLEVVLKAEAPGLMASTLADDNFNCIFLNENDRISIRFSLKFVPKNLIENKPALVEVMAWRRIGAKPLP